MVGLDVVIRMHDPARLDELGRAVFSAALQEYRPLAIHVVCQRFGAEDVASVRAALAPMLAIVPEVALHVHDRGEAQPDDARAALLNRGIGAAAGRYLAFLDYDDLIYPEGYRVLIGELEASGAAIAFGGVLNTEIAAAGMVPITVTKRRVFEGEGLAQLLRSNFCPLHSFVLDRSRIRRADLVVDETLVALEDWELLLRLCAAYPSSFRLKDKIVGEYLFKDDGSNSNPMAAAGSLADAWPAALAVVEARRATLVLGPAVQASLGVGQPGLTVAEFLAGAAGLPLRSVQTTQGETPMTTITRRAVLGTALALPAIRRAHAEVSEVMIAKQFGTLYLQQDVMEQQRMIEGAGGQARPANLKVTFVRLAGTGPVTDGLLSGKLHFASGGAPGAMLLWDRTRGGVKSCFAMNATDQKLVTVRPDLRSVKDLSPTDRIALPAVKTSPQAIWLQMAAAQAFGAAEWAKFDAQTVSRAHPDSMAQMLGRTEINCHWTTSPFQERELANPAVHEVASSFRIMGMPSVTPNTIYGNNTFRTENPLAWRACLAAFQESTDFINKDPRQAAELYLKNSGDKDTVDAVLGAMTTPGNRFTLQPAGLQKVANFMADTGVLKRRPVNLADLFFPEAADLGGS